jgi:AcrR family transcriptional regulator
MSARADKTAKGRATRRAFQEAARVVFARDGYVNARLADIADVAGKSVASFYNYYDSKEELLADIASDFDEELQSAVAEPFRRGLPVEQALRQSIADFWYHYRRRLPEVVGIFHASIVDPVFAERWRQIRTNGTTTIARGIRAAQAEGYAPGVEPLIAASALSGMMEHFCYVWQAQGGDAIDVELTDELALDTLWTIWTHAIYWKTPPEFPTSAASGDEEPHAEKEEPR